MIRIQRIRPCEQKPLAARQVLPTLDEILTVAARRMQQHDKRRRLIARRVRGHKQIKGALPPAARDRLLDDGGRRLRLDWLCRLSLVWLISLARRQAKQKAQEIKH